MAAVSSSLAQTLSTTTTSSEVETWGPAFVKVKGTWTGSTVALQFKDPGGNWITIDADTWTADAEKEAFFPYNKSTTIRFSMTAVSSPSVTCYALGSERQT